MSEQATTPSNLVAGEFDERGVDAPVGADRPFRLELVRDTPVVATINTEVTPAETRLQDLARRAAGLVAKLDSERDRRTASKHLARHDLRED